MIELELERTYLAKKIPDGIRNYPSREIFDVYIPLVEHPVLRLRKNGSRFQITKKQPKHENDASEQVEHTISLSSDEFQALSQITGKKLRKIRYEYPYQGRVAEIDIFQDDLEGLVLIDFEFDQTSSKDTFVIPEFCLIDVTQEKIFAGGMLCGKKYTDLNDMLNRVGYKPLKFEI